MSTRMKFGAFLAPHHPIGEHPTLQLRRDLELAAQLDELGYDEFWVGEHHSGGWETIGHPELFLAAAGERTHRIRLGTGVVSLRWTPVVGPFAGHSKVEACSVN
jgi:limonene 1,2-monooxygenase